MVNRIVAASAGFMLAWCALIGAAQAQQTLKVGLSVGLTGYVSGADRSWRDGALLAVDSLNAKGGVRGQKIEAVVTDNKSEPQEAVTGYRRMLSEDKVVVFVSGCLSSGNIAAAPMLVRAKVPMVVCSLLPSNPEQLKWSFSNLAPPKYDIAKQFEYLRDAGVKRVGILHDPSPYVLAEVKEGQEMASQYGLTIVGTESYKQDDADLSVQIGGLSSKGAQAIVKLGLGGTTLTTARNIQQLGLDLRLSVMTQDMSLFKQVSDIMGDKFTFVANPVQVSAVVPDSKYAASIKEFMALWTAKYADRDPGYGAKGWEAMMIVAEAARKAKTLDGAGLRDAIEGIDGFVNVAGIYSFGNGNNYGHSQNSYSIGTIPKGAAMRVVK